MFVYNYRIFDRYRRTVASLAVLGDENRTWRPQQFGYQLFGTEVNFRFPIVKLLDLNQQWSELESNRNPFATVVMAHLKALETRKNRRRRKEWKLILTKSLYEKGYTREDIINLFRFIDWVMSLPKKLENEFWIDVTNFEEERRMPYITSVERRGIEIGLEQGLEQGLAREKDLVIRLLKRKLGELDSSLERQVRSLEIEQLEALGEALLDFINVEDLRLWLS